jgi:hypothetical protein
MNEWMQYWFLLHTTAKIVLFISHFQILAKFGLYVNYDVEANNCLLSHIPTLLGPQDYTVHKKVWGWSFNASIPTTEVIKRHIRCAAVRF